jgi:hypothetical protein
MALREVACRDVERQTSGCFSCLPQMGPVPVDTGHCRGGAGLQEGDAKLTSSAADVENGAQVFLCTKRQQRRADGIVAQLARDISMGKPSAGKIAYGGALQSLSRVRGQQCRTLLLCRGTGNVWHNGPGESQSIRERDTVKCRLQCQNRQPGSPANGEIAGEHRDDAVPHAESVAR